MAFSPKYAPSLSKVEYCNQLCIRFDRLSEYAIRMRRFGNISDEVCYIYINLFNIFRKIRDISLYVHEKKLDIFSKRYNGDKLIERTIFFLECLFHLEISYDFDFMFSFQDVSETANYEIEKYVSALSDKYDELYEELKKENKKDFNKKVIELIGEI